MDIGLQEAHGALLTVVMIGAMVTLGGWFTVIVKPMQGLAFASLGVTVLSLGVYLVTSQDSENQSIAQEWAVSSEAKNVCVENFTKALDGRSLELDSYEDSNRGYREWEQLQMELQPQASVIIESHSKLDNDFGFYYDADSKETKFDCYGVGYLDEVNGISDVDWEPMGVFDKSEFIESSGVATPVPSPSENPVDETDTGGDESVPVLDCVTVVIDNEEKLLCDK